MADMREVSLQDASNMHGASNMQDVSLHSSGANTPLRSGAQDAEWVHSPAAPRRSATWRPSGVDAPSGYKVLGVLAAVILALCLISTLLMTLAPLEPPRPDWDRKEKTYPIKPGEHSFAITIAIRRQSEMEASTLVFVSFLVVLGAAIPSMMVATWNPELVPADFEAKGTLSNVAQDSTSPHGRLFTVMLFTAGIMQCFSTYTCWLYVPWQPDKLDLQNPWNTPVFEPDFERMWRTLWVTVPNVGFMFTAALPSLSDTDGYKLALALVHNVCAPLSMLFCVVMETWQLSYGEGAFINFFNSEADPPYSPLNGVTRIRVIILMYTWAAGFVFLGVQVYLGLALVGVKVKPTYPLALVSLYCEVFAMLFAFCLPTLAALERLVDPSHLQTTMDEAAWLLQDKFHLTTPPPPTLEM